MAHLIPKIPGFS